MGSRTLNHATTAEAYLELLADRGIDVFLGNAGTDFASLVEAFARREADGGRAPRPLVIPHEFVAVSMAHGYYAAGGRPAAVMVHVNVGTGNAATAIITASRANVPILMSAGRTPVTEEGQLGSRDLHIHWAQESFDQAAMLREYVKWDYELRMPAQVESVVCAGQPRCGGGGASDPWQRVQRAVPRRRNGDRPGPWVHKGSLDQGSGRARCRSGPALDVAGSHGSGCLAVSRRRALSFAWRATVMRGALRFRRNLRGSSGRLGRPMSDALA